MKPFSKKRLARALEAIEVRAAGGALSKLNPIDVALVRRRTGLTQRLFARRFGFSVATLRHWERGNRRPRGPALVLLHVIDRNPNAVLAALQAQSLWS